MTFPTALRLPVHLSPAALLLWFPSQQAFLYMPDVIGLLFWAGVDEKVIITYIQAASTDCMQEL